MTGCLPNEGATPVMLDDALDTQRRRMDAARKRLAHEQDEQERLDMVAAAHDVMRGMAHPVQQLHQPRIEALD